MPPAADSWKDRLAKWPLSLSLTLLLALLNARASCVGCWFAWLPVGVQCQCQCTLIGQLLTRRRRASVAISFLSLSLSLARYRGREMVSCNSLSRCAARVLGNCQRLAQAPPLAVGACEVVSPLPSPWLVVVVVSLGSPGVCHYLAPNHLLRWFFFPGSSA